jgi:hypothetical protein
MLEDATVGDHSSKLIGILITGPVGQEARWLMEVLRPLHGAQHEDSA